MLKQIDSLEPRTIWPRYLSTRAAALYLGLSTRWLEGLRQEGGGPVYSKPKKGGRRIVYCIDDLDAWVRAGRLRHTADPGSETDEV